MKCKCNFSTWL